MCVTSVKRRRMACLVRQDHGHNEKCLQPGIHWQRAISIVGPILLSYIESVCRACDGNNADVVWRLDAVGRGQERRWELFKSRATTNDRNNKRRRNPAGGDSRHHRKNTNKEGLSSSFLGIINGKGHHRGSLFRQAWIKIAENKRKPHNLLYHRCQRV